MTATVVAQNVTDAQYEAANAAIQAEATYNIYTLNNGTAEGSKRFYLTDGGWLSDDVAAAGRFVFHRTEGGGLYRSPGWQFDQYFTNPDCWNGQTEFMVHEGHIRTNASLARDDYEGQVWYKQGDTYAVRCTNATNSSWGANAFWSVENTGEDLPCADYSLTPMFTWRLEKIADAPDPGDPSDKEVSRLTNLPHVYINTFNGRNINSKTNYVYARMWCVYENDSVAFFDSLSIRGRGNATWGLAKKPYKLKFYEKEKLVGKGCAKAKKWTLLANHGDKTLIRNAVTSQMGEFMGLKFNPAAKFVDLTFNDRYDGTYQISDQVDVRPHRVNITEQDYPLSETSDITGGYLFENDNSGDFSNGTDGFYSDRGLPIRIHYPDVDELDRKQFDYARNFIRQFEQRLFSEQFADKDNGYRPYVDSLSLANWYLCTEMSGNVDGLYSTYFYKEAQDDHLFWGPLWDYDIAYNNDNRERGGQNNTTRQLMKDIGYGDMPKWVNKMWDDPWFARLINRRFHEAVDGGIEAYLNAQIDSLTQLIDASMQLNYQRWNINQRTLRELVLYNTYDEYVSDLRKYIHDHLLFLNDAFAELSPDDPVPGPGPGPDPDPEPKVPDFPADSMLYYAISNAGSGTFIDVRAEDDAIVCNARDEESLSQQWRIYTLANGFLYVVNRATGYALNDPTEGNPTATTLTGSQLSTAPGDSLDVRQQWDFVAQSDDRFNLVSRFSQHAANLNGGSRADGTSVLSYTSDERNSVSNNRMWRIDAVGNVEVEPDPQLDGIALPDFDYALAYDPVSQRLHFGADDLSALSFTVQVYDSHGRLLRTFRASDGTSLANLPRSLYLVTWTLDGRRRTVKLMKE